MTVTSPDHASFWGHESYAVVGHSSERSFPKLTYAGLKDAGKTVYPVDASTEHVEGDAAFPDLAALPGSVDGVVLEVPKDETAAWVERVAAAGIGRVWIHPGTDSPAALEAAAEQGLEVHSGNCAVMYLTRGMNAHGLHRAIVKLLGKY